MLLQPLSECVGGCIDKPLLTRFRIMKEELSDFRNQFLSFISDRDSHDIMLFGKSLQSDVIIFSHEITQYENHSSMLHDTSGGLQGPFQIRAPALGGMAQQIANHPLNMLASL